MTNFELMMLRIAQEIQKDKEVGLVVSVCNSGNLPCSQCPAKSKCDEWQHEPEKFEEWLRQGCGRMTDEEYKEKLLNAYTELIEKYKDDKQKLHEIDMTFSKPLEEANK